MAGEQAKALTDYGVYENLRTRTLIGVLGEGILENYDLLNRLKTFLRAQPRVLVSRALANVITYERNHIDWRRKTFPVDHILREEDPMQVVNKMKKKEAESKMFGLKQEEKEPKVFEPGVESAIKRLGKMMETERGFARDKKIPWPVLAALFPRQILDNPTKELNVYRERYKSTNLEMLRAYADFAIKWLNKLRATPGETASYQEELSQVKERVAKIRRRERTEKGKETRRLRKAREDSFLKPIKPKRRTRK